MTQSEAGGVPWRIFLIQLLLVAGLAVFLKFYLPHREREAVERARADREQKIGALFHDAVAEDAKHEISVPLNGAIVKRHPSRLRTTFSPRQAEVLLGAPDNVTADFAGGQHLTWIGTTHKLEASFNAGHLYCLTMEDRSTGHGEMVYESVWTWHPY